MNTRLHCIDADGTVYFAATFAADGAILWTYGIPENVSGVPAIDQAGNIHFGTDAGNYYIYFTNNRKHFSKLACQCGMLTP
ncbi:hypothetical protein AGMMS4956_04800 [Bacteroidia bacterium]|nr:hypothetical protein AGMMS4956_04800 [Bacteroidia bacterium]